MLQLIVFPTGNRLWQNRRTSHDSIHAESLDMCAKVCRYRTAKFSASNTGTEVSGFLKEMANLIVRRKIIVYL